MQIRYSKKFIKEFKKCPTNIQNSFKKRLIVFLNCPNHSLLNNHSLVGQLKGYKSINITGDWRAIFEEFNDKQTVYFVAIGTHSQLYYS